MDQCLQLDPVGVVKMVKVYGFRCILDTDRLAQAAYVMV